jgi:cytochrome oxidase Cu insertion factor (SCO1/SenC/PrrC family)
VPGMNSGLNPADPTIVNAFRSALLHQWLIAAAIFVLLLLVWGTTRAWATVQVTGGEAAGAGGPAVKAPAEPRARRLLRIAFGLIWVFDGLLQAQPKMAAGMPSQVIAPTAANSPAWVQHLVNWGGTIWSYHPVQAGASAVWIQVGIGLWLILAERGWWSRAAGLASVGWGLVVWVFGESFGGIFAPGLTWLFGAPGAVLFYAAAGALIALPERAWQTARIGRLILAGMGTFFIGMAVLQAWPGRGFWQGTAGGQPGTLTGMVQSMAQVSQPHLLSAMVSGFASFSAAHGFAVNLFTVIALAVLGAAFLAGRPRLVRPAVIAATVLCLADWVLIEDLGFLGGLGTDPNSMIPMILLFTAGYLALTPVPAVAEPAAAPAAVPWRERLRPAAVRGAIGAVSIRTAAALGAIGVILVGAAPMAAASANRNADPIIAEAISGSTGALDQPAPAFQLTSQDGKQVTLASLRGKVVLLTFLDPVCVSDCPLIAQEVRQAGQLLGTDDRQVELVAIVINPLYYNLAYTQAFDKQENLDTVPNWLYLTGSPGQLENIWRGYGVTAEISTGGAMVAHDDIAFVLDRSGNIREELSDDPGPGTTSTKSSYAVLLADAARQTLRQP